MEGGQVHGIVRLAAPVRRDRARPGSSPCRGCGARSGRPDGGSLGPRGDAMGDAGSGQGLSHHCQLVVGSGQNRLIRPPHPRSRPIDQEGGHALGLGDLVVVGGHHRHRPLTAGGRRRGGRRGSEGGTGGRHHLGCRPVVLAESQHLHAGDQLRQAMEEAMVGTVPSVDGLIRITHRAEVDPRTGECRDQSELGRVYVLEFVHREMPVAPVDAFGEADVVVDEVGGPDQDVVQVEHPPLAERRFVGLEPGRHLVAGHGAGAADQLGLFAIGGRGQAVGLGPGDFAVDGRGDGRFPDDGARPSGSGARTPPAEPDRCPERAAAGASAPADGAFRHGRRGRVRPRRRRAWTPTRRSGRVAGAVRGPLCG